MTFNYTYIPLHQPPSLPAAILHIPYVILNKNRILAKYSLTDPILK